MTDCPKWDKRDGIKVFRKMAFNFINGIGW